MYIILFLLISMVNGLNYNRHVLKFGGSSLKTSKNIKNACNIIKQSKENNEYPIVVCSALGCTTNDLINLYNSKNFNEFSNLKRYHYSIMNELDIVNPNTFDSYNNLFNKLYVSIFNNNEEDNKKQKDLIISFGERLSVFIVSNYLNKINVESSYFNSYDLGLITNDNFCNANILKSSYNKLEKYINLIDCNLTPVITGFIGKTMNGDITTLGRGGSDLTATIIAKSISAKQVNLWKDVDGIFTADPNIIENAKLIETISFRQTCEMALHGANILHPISLNPCRNTNIPVIVKNTLNTSSIGTKISNTDFDDNLVTALTFKNNISVIDINTNEMIGKYGFLSNVFDNFKNNKISIDVLSSSESSISFSIDDEDLDNLKYMKNSNMNVRSNLSTLSIICDANKTSAILCNVFEILKRENIKVEMISKGISKINITLIIDSKDIYQTVKLLHNLLIE